MNLVPWWADAHNSLAQPWVNAAPLNTHPGT
jgi:hypothetical protein